MLDPYIAVGLSSFPPWLGSLIISLPNPFSFKMIEGWASTIVVFLVIGLAAGAIVKHASKWFILLFLFFLGAIFFGYATSDQVRTFFAIFQPELTSVPAQLGLFVPTTGVIFALGFGIGLWKG